MLIRDSANFDDDTKLDLIGSEINQIRNFTRPRDVWSEIWSWTSSLFLVQNFHCFWKLSVVSKVCLLPSLSLKPPKRDKLRHDLINYLCTLTTEIEEWQTLVLLLMVATLALMTMIAKISQASAIRQYPKEKVRK